MPKPTQTHKQHSTGTLGAVGCNFCGLVECVLLLAMSCKLTTLNYHTCLEFEVDNPLHALLLTILCGRVEGKR